MGKLSTRVIQLREDLRQLLGDPHPAQREMDRVRDNAADLLLRALSDGDHPLVQDLDHLKRRVKLECEGVPDRDQAYLNAKSLRHLFMPLPGMSDSEARRLWRLQLLLQTAVRSPTHSSRLADCLALSPELMQEAADEAAKASVALWTRHQYVELLEGAVTALDAPDPPLPFQLKDRLFIHRDGARITLSPMEAKFLQMLVDRAGQPVTFSAFEKAGVRNPTRVKNRLLKRLREAGVELHVAAATRMYTLPTSEP
jgi:hypothetical protein